MLNSLLNSSFIALKCCTSTVMHFALNPGCLLAFGTSVITLHTALEQCEQGSCGHWTLNTASYSWTRWVLWTLDTLHTEQWTLLWNNVSKMVLVDTEERGWDGLLRSRWTSSTKHCKWNHGTRWSFLKIQIFKGLFWSNFYGAWPVMELGAIFVVTDRFTDNAILGVG